MALQLSGYMHHLKSLLDIEKDIIHRIQKHDNYHASLSVPECVQCDNLKIEKINSSTQIYKHLLVIITHAEAHPEVLHIVQRMVVGVYNISRTINTYIQRFVIPTKKGITALNKHILALFNIYTKLTESPMFICNDLKQKGVSFHLYDEITFSPISDAL